MSKGKIVKYKLEKQCLELRRQDLSLAQIADELNKNMIVPKDDQINKFTVKRYLDSISMTEQVSVSKKVDYETKLVTTIDLLDETRSLYNKTMSLLLFMEESAEENDKCIDPYRFKAVVGEARAFLQQMKDLQKEVSNYNDINKFIEVVLTVLKEECPEKIPVIVEKLKLDRGTAWFSQMMGGE